MWIRRSVPPARPGIAVSQNSSVSENLNPIPGNRTTTALITNHVANDRISENVVIHSVRHAIGLPVFSQKSASSGRQSVIGCFTILVLGVFDSACRGEAVEQMAKPPNPADGRREGQNDRDEVCAESCSGREGTDFRRCG